MFTNISWKEYTIFILITLIIYYFILLIVFYKAEFARFINNLHLRNAGSNFNGEYSLLENNKEELLSDNIETPAIINRLQNEITMQLEGGKIKSSVKEEIIMSLQLVLQHYNSLNKSQYKDSINFFIKAACENICSIHLDNAEIDQLWFR